MSWIDEGGEVADFHPELQGDAKFNRHSAEQLFEGSSLTFEEALDAADEARPLSTALGIEVTMYRRAEHERITSPNVVGILRGRDPELANEYVVYSTHLDHLGTGAPIDGDSIYNGLYDNALGVAVTIEIARAFASLSVPPRRSIVFVAVTGEEEKLAGSDYFAHYPTVPSSAIVANVNIDMPMFLFPMNTVTGYGAEHSSLEGLTTEEARKEGFEYIPDPFPDQVYFIRSDQYSFVRQGIPSVYLAEGIGSSDPAVDGRAVLDAFFAEHYHQPSDDLSQPIEWETALRFSRAGARIGYRIAMEDQRPTWNEGDFFGEKFGH
jgi:Zn-dependent M28 family amino/carboxypeptidase